MNERMIELHKQAAEFAYKTCKEEGRTGAQTEYIRNILTTAKFAELIVRECAELTLAHRNDDYYNGWLDYRDEICRHFGVAD